MFSHRKGKIERLCDSELAWSDIVKIPEKHEEDDTRDDVARPDVGQGQVVREHHGLGDGRPGHPLRAVRLLEPCHQEAEVEAEVGHQGDGHLGADAPGEVVVGGDEAEWKPRPEMEEDPESDGEIC